MLTWIEIDGFKSFRNFKAPLAPFQVIIGANGVGKSNLFDALHLLAKLAETDLRSALLDVRGNAGELFTVEPTGEPVPMMRFAVELLVDRRVRDGWGNAAALKYTRMRYELEIKQRLDTQGLEPPYVTHESLKPIQHEDDVWLHNLGLDLELWIPPPQTARETPFISTESAADNVEIHLHQDGNSQSKVTIAKNAERTVLSGVLNTEFPHAFAAREEMCAWRRLQLNPVVLRESNHFLDSTHLSSEGKFLARTLARLDAEDEGVLTDISADLAYLVPEIGGISVEPDHSQKRYLVKATTRDGCQLSASVLSDGTLRLLALLALKYDPEHHGVLCFEEPENGIHPRRLTQMVEEILHPLATEFAEDDPVLPLRQLLVNTHSPVLAQALGKENLERELLFTTMVSQTAPDGLARITRLYPVQASGELRANLGIGEEVTAYTLGEVIAYLESADPSHIIAQLRGA